VRRIPLSYRSHVTGFQGLPSGAIDYESALERDFVLLTLFDDPSARIRSQPVTLNFEHEGRHRRYTPDYLIEGGGRFELIEIKYEADLQRTCSVPQNGAGASSAATPSQFEGLYTLCLGR
jgi:TnsA endonuclease N terminal